MCYWQKRKNWSAGSDEKTAIVGEKWAILTLHIVQEEAWAGTGLFFDIHQQNGTSLCLNFRPLKRCRWENKGSKYQARVDRVTTWTIVYSSFRSEPLSTAERSERVENFLFHTTHDHARSDDCCHATLWHLQTRATQVRGNRTGPRLHCSQ